MATIECDDCDYNGDAVLLDSGVYVCPICGEEATEYNLKLQHKGLGDKNNADAK